MSYTNLYGIKSDFTAVELKQYKNSWLFLPQIYKILGEKYLNENGIGTVKHYPIPMHLQEAYKDLNIKEGSLPIAEEISKTVLSIPMYYGMTDEEVNYVIDKLNAFK